MNNQFGLKLDTITKIQAVLASFSAIEEAILYGSRAKGNYKNGSDIDLTLKTSKQHTRQSSNTSLSLIEIGIALDELGLPYSIDLSHYENINDPDLIDHINRVGVVFYKHK